MRTRELCVAEAQAHALNQINLCSNPGPVPSNNECAGDDRASYNAWHITYMSGVLAFLGAHACKFGYCGIQE